MNAAIRWWVGLPKWLRFSLYYGLSPLWFPPSLILLLAAYVVLAPLMWLMEAWEDF